MMLLTKELLDNANSLQNRINQVTKLLEQIDLTDPSGMDTTVRVSPIVIQVGMAQTLQFDVLPADEADPNKAEVVTLDNRVHDMIVTLLKDYKVKLEDMFNKLV